MQSNVPQDQAWQEKLIMFINDLFPEGLTYEEADEVSTLVWDHTKHRINRTFECDDCGQILPISLYAEHRHQKSDSIEPVESINCFFAAFKEWLKNNPSLCEPKLQSVLEAEIEKAFGKSLEENGIPVQYQVRCKYGRADIVTPDAIYEIKASLSRSNIHKAVSQVLLYRSCINPSARAVIVGYPYKGKPVEIELANALGVEVIMLNV